MLERRWPTLVAAVTVGVLSATAATAAPARRTISPTGAAWRSTVFASGFANSSQEGPTSIAMSPSGKLYVADLVTGQVYVFGPHGGTAGTATLLPQSNLSDPIDLAFTPDGHLYASEEFPAAVVELDPKTGAILRTVASGMGAADGLAVDPLSGDLFVSEFTNAGQVDRISSLDTSTPTLQTGYATGFDDPDGIAFGPGGTLYVSANGDGQIWAVAGTRSAQPGAKVSLTTLAVTGPDGLMVGNGFLLLNNNDGTVTQLSLAAGHGHKTVFHEGSRGDIAGVGGDGCGYATQSDTVIRITNRDGSCSLVPDVRFDGPVATADAATRLKVHSAVLHGAVNPLGAATTANFDWGTTPAFGHSTPAKSFPADAASHSTKAKLTGLKPGKRYYYRLRTRSSAGATYSTLRSFTTRKS